MIRDGLSGRLLSVAEFVRQDAIFADIGTDHAYLPLFLLSTGRIRRAFCSDINRGPLDSAMANAREAGLDSAITFTLADGAAALADRGITDYAICGMGGELIADIIDRAPHLRSPDVNLILQPMTRHGHLRAYLAREGFSILSESYSQDAGKLYVAMLVRYSGVLREIDACDAELGDPDCEITGLVWYAEYLRAKISTYERVADGKIRGGEAFPRELEFIKAARARLDDLTALVRS